jgi:hypothetical protein
MHKKLRFTGWAFSVWQSKNTHPPIEVFNPALTALFEPFFMHGAGVFPPVPPFLSDNTGARCGAAFVPEYIFLL